jgi:hypothetical protein
VELHRLNGLGLPLTELARIYGFIGFFRPPGFSDYHLWLRTYSRKARTAALVCRRLG